MLTAPLMPRGFFTPSFRMRINSVNRKYCADSLALMRIKSVNNTY